MQIIDSAIELIAEQGYARASLAHIAAKAGIWPRCCITSGTRTISSTRFWPG
ncbi:MULTISPECIES: helix-turn-helix domain-containing protein [unclassified Rhodococcus (in: high G+C Gram-positive bacteria)]|uniref:TetR/AcrR family transcriptional regulator n=1 Tax=unclassified Rhodococcus (in: high G+C Gram-positive bacteria) TaxID=192944 RepID=UPI00314056C9